MNFSRWLLSGGLATAFGIWFWIGSTQANSTVLPARAWMPAADSSFLAVTTTMPLASSSPPLDRGGSSSVAPIASGECSAWTDFSILVYCSAGNGQNCSVRCGSGAECSAWDGGEEGTASCSTLAPTGNCSVLPMPLPDPRTTICSAKQSLGDQIGLHCSTLNNSSSGTGQNCSVFNSTEGPNAESYCSVQENVQSGGHAIRSCSVLFGDGAGTRCSIFGNGTKHCSVRVISDQCTVRASTATGSCSAFQGTGSCSVYNNPAAICSIPAP